MTCEWLSPRQAAKRVGVTRSTIYKWIRDGLLKYYRTPGGTIRICQDDLTTVGTVEDVST